MKFSDILSDYKPYIGIKENIDKGAVSVAGIAESAQGQLICSLAGDLGVSALVICYTDAEARKMYSDLQLYTDSALYFPSKEYVFYNIETSGRQNEHARISVLRKLISGKGYVVVTSLDAVLQFTADKDEFKNLCVTFEAGKRFDLGALSERLVIMGYTREEAIRKMRGALGELVIEGITTNLDLQYDLIGSLDFREGNMSAINAALEERCRRVC